MVAPSIVPLTAMTSGTTTIRVAHFPLEPKYRNIIKLYDLGGGTSDGKRGVMVKIQRTVEKVAVRVGRQASLRIDPQI